MDIGRRLRYAAAAAITVLCLSSTATVAAITVLSAKIEAGRLKVTGSSPTGTSVKLDTVFSAPINSARTFSFSLLYLPPDCIVDLTLVGAVAPLKRALVANCGPQGDAGAPGITL